jgi:hypothetical protein
LFIDIMRYYADEIKREKTLKLPLTKVWRTSFISSNG